MIRSAPLRCQEAISKWILSSPSPHWGRRIIADMDSELPVPSLGAPDHCRYGFCGSKLKCNRPSNCTTKRTVPMQCSSQAHRVPAGAATNMRPATSGLNKWPTGLKSLMRVLSLTNTVPEFYAEVRRRRAGAQG